jgi:hypothetical protein
MDKLIKYLNEYEKEKKSWFIWRSIDSYDNCVYGVDCDWETEITMYSDLYSKYYGFIKWLVENDKIDFDKVEKKFYNEICITDYWDKDRIYWESDLVIAVLSISDTPIEDLISYLQE